MRRLIALVLLCCALVVPAVAAENDPEGIKWQPWSESVFETARQENKFVLLDLEAVWCHWCHVMDEKTYRDPDVIRLIREKFVAVKVDQDARPDLSNRYEDYGWPATIVFNADGGEIVKRSGYIRPEAMKSMLEAIIKDPTPGPSVQAAPALSYASTAALSEPVEKELAARLIAGYDSKNKGWGRSHKFLDWDTVEYCIARGRAGDTRSETMARETVDAQLKLMDPVWGGVYQYSTDGDWEHPHFEKIMAMQGENMRIYALAYSLWNDPRYLQTAESISRYLSDFLLSPDGAFYTSQDADVVKGQHSADYFDLADKERRARGIPRVDRHIYARENGWAVNGLAALYQASGKKQYLDQAKKAAAWIIDKRSLSGGGFRHDEQDAAGPYLGDTLAMGRAFLSLYQATGDRQWLGRAEQAADFIGAHFDASASGGAGFTTTDASGKGIHPPALLLDENVTMARFANLLFHYSGRDAYKKMAENAMRYVATPEVALKRQTLVGGPLLADMELSGDPAHVTVVGGKDDPLAAELFAAALRYPSGYKRIEWWDSREGPLPNSDVEYPQLKTAAAFGCSNGRCSRPVTKPAEVSEMVDRLGKS